VPTFGEVVCRAVYPQIDLVYHTSAASLEYDFVVAPGGDPKAIRFSLVQGNGTGSEFSARIDPHGALRLSGSAGEFNQLPPIAYQETPRGRTRIPSRYRVAGTDRASGRTYFGIAVDRYDPALPLIIDPVLAYSTYLGGSAEETSAAVTTDRDGNLYVAGTTASLDFPTSQPFPGAPPASKNAYLLKLSPDARTLLYSTYFGGTGEDEARAVGIDSAGKICIAGRTTSADFPVAPLPGVLQGQRSGPSDGFVTKLSPTGDQVRLSTYLGQASDDQVNGLAVGSDDSLYLAGTTVRATSSGDPQSDAFLARLLPDDTLRCLQKLGGAGQTTGNGLALDPSGNVHLTGDTTAPDLPLVNALSSALSGSQDAFVASFDPDGDCWFCTYLGGASEDSGTALAAGEEGALFVAGNTGSDDFPVPNGLFHARSGGKDAFVAKLKPATACLLFATYLGSTADDSASGIAVRPGGPVWVVGTAAGSGLPLRDALQDYRSGTDAFVVGLNDPGTKLVFGSYFGGAQDESGTGIVLDTKGMAVVAGTTTDHPRHTPAQRIPIRKALQPAPAGSGDAFLFRLDPISSPRLRLSSRRVNFGSMRARSAKTLHRRIQIRNPEDGTVMVSVSNPVPPFSTKAKTKPIFIPPHGKATLTVCFEPQVPGRYSGQLQLVAGETAYPVQLLGRAR
jgi:hypothetical protein